MKRKIERRLNNMNIELNAKLKIISKQNFNSSLSSRFAAKLLSFSFLIKLNIHGSYRNMYRYYFNESDHKFKWHEAHDVSWTHLRGILKVMGISKVFHFVQFIIYKLNHIFELDSNSQNHSSSDSHHPIKKSPPPPKFLTPSGEFPPTP